MLFFFSGVHINFHITSIYCFDKSSILSRLDIDTLINVPLLITVDKRVM